MKNDRSPLSRGGEVASLSQNIPDRPTELTGKRDEIDIPADHYKLNKARRIRLKTPSQQRSLVGHLFRRTNQARNFCLGKPDYLVPINSWDRMPQQHSYMSWLWERIKVDMKLLIDTSPSDLAGGNNQWSRSQSSATVIPWGKSVVANFSVLR